MARELRGISQAEAAAHLGITAAALSQFESGSARPTESTLERLRLEYGVPGAFFTLASEKVHEGFFRSLRKTSVMDRRRAQAVAFVAHDVATLSPSQMTFPSTSIPRHSVAVVSSSPDDIELAASRVRMDWG